MRCEDARHELCLSPVMIELQRQDGAFTLSFSLGLQPFITWQKKKNKKKLCGSVGLVLQSHTNV